MTDTDGINEAVEGAERIVVMTAARIAETVSRVRRELVERARARDEREAAEYRARYDAQRALARAELRPIADEGWWRRASVDEVARAYEVAATWRDEDPQIAQLHSQLSQRVRERFGFDPSTDEPVTPGGLSASQRLLEGRASAERRRAQASADVIEAHMLLADAAALDAAAAEAARTVEALEAGIDWERGSVHDVELFVEVETVKHERDERRQSADERRDRAEHLQLAAEQSYGSADEIEQGSAELAKVDREREEAETLRRRAASLESELTAAGDGDRRHPLAVDAAAVRQRADDLEETARGREWRGEELYGTVEWRERFAGDLRRRGHDDQAVRDRLVPELDQATHPREAVREGPRKRARPGKAWSQEQDRSRGRER